jgi:ParB-like chromosome segregation protein Spo0J
MHIDTYAEFVDLRPSLVPATIKSGELRRSVPAPCMNTLLVPPALVVANDYNPNSVSPDKMNLLRQSILDNGWCFPVVVIADDEQERFVVIDGFHRTVIGGGEWLAFDYIPIVVLEHDMAKRLAATVQFNKAKGHHQVDLDAEVIRKLLEQGLTDEDVAERLGIGLDDVHRYKQVSGVAALFANTPHSLAWEMVDDEG